MQDMIKKLQQSFQVSFQYDVCFTNHIWKPTQSLLIDTIQNHTTIAQPKVLVVLDDGLILHYPDLIPHIQEYFSVHEASATLTRAPMLVPGGETCKNSDQWVQEILRAVHEDGIDRHSFVLAIGGGAVLDMAGYAAAIAHRGVRHIRIPTTVLSQNDSGVGVKNAINAFGKKNFLGCFTPPVAVINDFTFLQSLHDRDWRSGISEAVKVALIKDAAFFTFLENHCQQLADRNMEAMQTLIIDCARLHMEHISGGDPFEMGSSRPLDFGHWAAHKLEQITNYELRHGEAVAIGIVLDTTYSYLDGLIDEASWKRVVNLFEGLGFELFHPALLAKDGQELAVIKGLGEFREHLGGQLTIMLLESIGRGIEVHEMNEALIVQSIATMQNMALELKS